MTLSIHQTLATATICTWANFHQIQMEGALNQIWIKCKNECLVHPWDLGPKCCLNPIWILLEPIITSFTLKWLIHMNQMRIHLIQLGFTGPQPSDSEYHQQNN